MSRRMTEGRSEGVGAAAVEKPAALASPRVTFEKLTEMLVERNRSEALGRLKEDGQERYTYLWYGGPTMFFRRLDLKLSDATLDGWRRIFDSLLEQAYGSGEIESAGTAERDAVSH